MSDNDKNEINKKVLRNVMMMIQPLYRPMHEVLGSVKLAEEGGERHNHRFATVTTEVIPIEGGGHKHVFLGNTDFFGHYHEVAGETGPAIRVGNGKHVHFAMGESTIDDGHFHNFQFATLIESIITEQNVIV